MKYITGVDTIKFNINVVDQKKQYDLVESITSFIHDKIEPLEVVEMECLNRKKCTVSKNKDEILVIKTELTRMKDEVDSELEYNVLIEFTGLRTHKDSLDKTSAYCFRRVVKFLNTNDIDYKIIELGIYLDIACKPQHIVAIKKEPYKVLSEKINEEDIPESPVGACYYNLELKYNRRFDKRLAFNATRFEFKFQSKFFSSNDYSLETIEKEFNKYNILYLENLYQRFSTNYNNFDETNTNHLRLIPDLNSIEYLLNELSITSHSKENKKIIGDSHDI